MFVWNTFATRHPRRVGRRRRVTSMHGAPGVGDFAAVDDRAARLATQIAVRALAGAALDGALDDPRPLTDGGRALRPAR